MYIYLTFTIAVIVILYALLTWVHNRPSYKVALGIASVLYAFALIYFTFVRGRRNDLARISIKPPFYFIRAIRSGRYRAVTNRSLLNMLLFVPFGYLLPQIFTVSGRKKTAAACRKIVLCGFWTSLLIETCQLIFHRGVFELDDLVKNTIGTAAGWLIWKVTNMIQDKQSVDE